MVGILLFRVGSNCLNKLIRIFALWVAVVGLAACGSLFDKRSSSAQRERPAPGSVHVTDDWHCVADDTGRWRCRARGDTDPASPVAVAYPMDPGAVEPLAEPESVTVPEPAPAAVPLREGYVLQFAAFHNLDQAQEVLRDLPAFPARILRTRGPEGDWYVVVGDAAYPSRGDAVAAAEEQLPGVDYWVRQAPDLDRDIMACPLCTAGP